MGLPNKETGEILWSWSKWLEGDLTLSLEDYLPAQDYKVWSTELTDIVLLQFNDMIGDDIFKLKTARATWQQ